MTLRFTVLGFELARVELDIEREPEAPPTPVDKGAKAVSKWFFSKMVR